MQFFKIKESHFITKILGCLAVLPTAVALLGSYFFSSRDSKTTALGIEIVRHSGQVLERKNEKNSQSKIRKTILSRYFFKPVCQT